MPLNTTTVNKAEPRDKPYRIADEKGLCLQVNPCGSKLWRFRYRFHGLPKMISLGAFPEITVDDARARRDICRKHLAKGLDPSEVRKAERKARYVTFRDVAQEWLAQHAPRWSPKHAEITESRLQKHIYPTLGNRPIAHIVPIEVVWLTQKIEKTGNIDTAHRVLGVIGQVMRYAMAIGRAKVDPTAGMQIALAPKPRKKHMAAPTQLDETRRMLERVRSAAGNPRLSLQVQIGMQLLPLVFCRPGELRHMRWEDIHWDRQEWRFTASKTKTPHLAPLSRQAMDLLRQILPLTGHTPYVFASPQDLNKPASQVRPMSEMSLNNGLKILGIDTRHELTAHGWRAVARTLLAEELHYPPEVIEQQLAHRVPDALGRAYNRTRYLAQRQQMMQDWADFLDRLAPAVGKGTSGAKEMVEQAETFVAAMRAEFMPEASDDNDYGMKP